VGKAKMNNFQLPQREAFNDEGISIVREHDENMRFYYMIVC
jgi:hypothetical protein